MCRVLAIGLFVSCVLFVIRVLINIPNTLSKTNAYLTYQLALEKSLSVK